MVLGAIGGVIGGGITSGVQAGESKKQRDWATKMYKRRYQYTMADMRAAGLNPILAYQTGVGGPGGGAAAYTPDFGQAMAAGVQAQAATSAKSAQVDLLNAQTGTEKERRRLVISQSQEAISRAHLFHAQERGQIFSAKHLEASLPAAKSRQAVDEHVMGRRLREIGRISEGLWDIVTPGVLRRKRK